MRRLLGTLLVLALIGIAANDIVRVARASSHLRGVTYDLALSAAEDAVSMPRDKVASQLYKDAEAQGVTLYAYDQTDSVVRVFASQEVTSTIVAGPVYNLMLGAPLKEAISTPLTIQDRRNAGIAR